MLFYGITPAHFKNIFRRINCIIIFIYGSTCCQTSVNVYIYHVYCGSMSVDLEHTVDRQNKTNILNGHLTTMLNKPKPTYYVKYDKLFFYLARFASKPRKQND